MMRLATLISLIVAIPATLAFPSHEETRRCATHVTAEEADAMELRFAADFAAKSADRVETQAAFAASIPVVWHVIHSSNSLVDGYLPDSAIEQSITAMNQHYSGAGFSFRLTNITRTNNPTWFSRVNFGNSYQTAMKTALRSGGAETLNVYTVAFSDRTLGYSSFPSAYKSNPVDDGVVIYYSTYPGGSSKNYDQGKTLTHETGHWLGLYHVFQGGCTGDGDYVADTPPQVTATYGCPTSQDSCSGGGADSIHNYMDYSYDACMSEFTPGQISRAQTQTSTYRGY